MGVSAEKRAEFTVRGTRRRIECAQVQRESLVETPLESNGPAEKPCLRRLRAVGKRRKHTKQREHGGETLSHAPIVPSDHKLSKVNHFTAATVVSNTPVRILPSVFVCTQMRYGPDFGNAYGNETAPAVPTPFVWLL